MKCEEFNRLLPKFIDDTLESEYYDEFVNHAKECYDCRDELEIHYMIRVGLERIENDSGKSFDIRGELENRLSEYENRADLIFKRNVYKNVIVALAEICAVAVSIIQIIKLI